MIAGIRPLGLRAIHQVVREAKRDRYVKTEQARASAEGFFSAVGESLTQQGWGLVERISFDVFVRYSAFLES